MPEFDGFAPLIFDGSGGSTIDILGFLIGIVNYLLAVIVAVANIILQIISDLINALLTVFRTLGKFLLQIWTSYIKRAVTWLATHVQKLRDRLQGTIGPIIKRL